MKHIYFIKEKGGFINVLIGKDAWCCKNGYYKSDASLDDHSIEENAAGMIVGKSCVPRWKGQKGNNDCKSSKDKQSQ